MFRDVLRGVVRAFVRGWGTLSVLSTTSVLRLSKSRTIKLISGLSMFKIQARLNQRTSLSAHINASLVVTRHHTFSLFTLRKRALERLLLNRHHTRTLLSGQFILGSLVSSVPEQRFLIVLGLLNGNDLGLDRHCNHINAILLNSFLSRAHRNISSLLTQRTHITLRRTVESGRAILTNGLTLLIRMTSLRNAHARSNVTQRLLQKIQRGNMITHSIITRLPLLTTRFIRGDLLKTRRRRNRPTNVLVIIGVNRRRINKLNSLNFNRLKKSGLHGLLQRIRRLTLTGRVTLRLTTGHEILNGHNTFVINQNTHTTRVHNRRITRNTTLSVRLTLTRGISNEIGIRSVRGHIVSFRVQRSILSQFQRRPM